MEEEIIIASEKFGLYLRDGEESRKIGTFATVEAAEAARLEYVKTALLNRPTRDFLEVFRNYVTGLYVRDERTAEQRESEDITVINVHVPAAPKEKK